MSSEWKEETLDPENWDEMRALGHRMLDDVMNCLENIRTQPFTFPSKEAIDGILSPLTDEGEGEEKIYEVFLNHIMPHVHFHTKPIFWGVVAGTGSPYGVLTEMLASSTNHGLETVVAGAYTHQQVIEWIKELLEYPKEAGGVLVSGGSEANFTCLAVARNAKAKKDMKTQGVYGQPERMTLYCSEETHHCLERSAELLGLGNDALRWLPTDDECRLKISSLRNAIKEDRKNNYHPFCIIGNAGTVNSGSFDDFRSIAEICKKEDLWFHIDGAFGSWVKLSKTHRHLADGIELADSLAVDLHKWMYMPYGIGCALVKHRLEHYKTFVYGHEAEYLKSKDAVERILKIDVLNNPHNLALPLSRNFTSLKAYMLLRAYGKEKYSRLIQQNIDQINYLTRLIEAEPELEVTFPVMSNVVCFRYNPNNLTEQELEELNKMIIQDLYQINFWIISDTTIKGKYTLRACCTNHRSKKHDFDFLVNEVKKIGRKNYSIFK
jgi:glutamate/tyrosine decarboxylase-like PLP-dependent enzyme